MTRYFGVHTLEGEWHSLLPRYVLMSDRVADKQILDIGCGTGIGSSLLLEMGAKSVNAIDHRPEVLELARVKHAKQGLNFNVMFWEELDFPDDAFDMVLCLDPTSPVTDPSLLLEVTRVLRTGGEYVCAIERRNIDGIESLLPRYGYGSAGEELPLNQPGERVPQIGNLEEFFTTIHSIVQRPRYSFVFDHARHDDDRGMRRRTNDPEESGIWVGDDPTSEEGSAEQTDERPGRWIEVDERLCARDGEPSSVELLYCGDEHIAAPTLREVQMPYRGLVDRLHQLFSDLQLRQHPDQSTPGSEAPNDGPFRERTETSEFRPLNERSSSADDTGVSGLDSDTQVTDRTTTSVHSTDATKSWQQVRQQLDHMTQLYEQVRAEMQTLFTRTRQELAQRDRYIEQLVDTVHRWRHESDQISASQPAAAPVKPDPDPADEAIADFEREPTSIFTRNPDLEAPGDAEASETDSDDADQPTPSNAEDTADKSDDREPQRDDGNDDDAAPPEAGEKNQKTDDTGDETTFDDGDDPPADTAAADTTDDDDQPSTSPANDANDEDDTDDVDDIEDDDAPVTSTSSE